MGVLMCIASDDSFKMYLMIALVFGFLMFYRSLTIHIHKHRIRDSLISHSNSEIEAAKEKIS